MIFPSLPERSYEYCVQRDACERAGGGGHDGRRRTISALTVVRSAKEMVPLSGLSDPALVGSD